MDCKLDAPIRQKAPELNCAVYIRWTPLMGPSWPSIARKSSLKLDANGPKACAFGSGRLNTSPKGQAWAEILTFWARTHLISSNSITRVRYRCVKLDMNPGWPRSVSNRLTVRDLDLDLTGRHICSSDFTRFERIWQLNSLRSGVLPKKWMRDVSVASE